MSNIKATLTPQNRLLVTNYAVGETAGSIRVQDLFDVDASGLAHGAVLVYNVNQTRWEATVELDNEATVLEGGTF
jgi:hypothetical protein